MPQPLLQYVVDAFAEQVFGGNPAAVCPLSAWPEASCMQAIARENNISETAFVVPEGPNGRYGLRWFAPGGEVDLCGHATLATAAVLWEQLDEQADSVTFNTRGGQLQVRRAANGYVMDFPSFPLRQVPVTDDMVRAVSSEPVQAWLGRDLVLVLADADEVRHAFPDRERILMLDGLLLHVTAQGDGQGIDCVTRSFGPKLEIDEDPVCGSGHCHVAPLWADRLGKSALVAQQASARGGILHCRVGEGRVEITGKAALYSRAEIFVPGLGDVHSLGQQRS